MGYDWVIHAVTFLVLVSYRGEGARYRAGVSFGAAALTGLSLGATFYTAYFPAPLPVTVIGVILLVAVIRCRGNVAQIMRNLTHVHSPRRH